MGCLPSGGCPHPLRSEHGVPSRDATSGLVKVENIQSADAPHHGFPSHGGGQLRGQQHLSSWTWHRPCEVKSSKRGVLERSNLADHNGALSTHDSLSLARQWEGAHQLTVLADLQFLSS